MARDDRPFSAWVPWAVGLVGGALVVAAQLVWVRGTIEDDLATRVKAALDEATVAPGAVVTAQGCDVTVSGVPETGVDATQAALIIGDVKGVRSFTIEYVPVPQEGEDVAEEPAPEPTLSPEPTPSPGPTKTADPAPTPTAGAQKSSGLPPVVFERGTLWTDESNPVLKLWAHTILNGPPDAKYEVQGHADLSGDPDVNQVVSQRRAEAVRAELINRGVPARQLNAVGYGSTTPVVDPEKTDDDKMANRRVIILVVDLPG
ncbi:MAG: OmpA family protein [Micrococcales bacterium]|nr:OmpA family protein [Micrococcales bacterium]MCL2667551.1 OmpA family protein [Micrococcales bacterium]